MISKTKFAAFTILEILITLILSVVVVSMLYSLYSVVHKEWHIINKQQNNITTLIQFRKTIHNDISNARHMYANSSEELYVVTEQFATAKTDTVRYLFGSLIIRIVKNNIDTFNISTNNLHYFHVECFQDSSVIKKIKFDILAPLHINHVSFQKRYTSSELMSLSFDNGYK